MTRIAINVAARHHRSSKSRPEPQLGLGDEDQCLAQEPTQPNRVAATEAWKALCALPEKLRVVLVLRDIEEMTLEEVASATETPLSTVVSRLGRARQLLARTVRRRGNV